ncbi:DNA-binding transcriptional LysR family regulator [Devosia sp. UYZn731]|uniref:LysR family transcriptional regulator n=1 Tax=Devosia sp. UYZn731 TaxID=3156345 RepID=UPI00339251B3
MDKLKALTVFVRVADLGSLAAAARDTGLSPAMVGNHIRALEVWLNASLLVRTTRRQALTDVGLDVLARARSVIAGIDALDRVSDKAEMFSGPLHISAPLALGRRCVAPILRDLARTHPELTIELRLSDDPEDLVISGVDIAVRNGPLTGNESSLIARVIARQSLILVASPGYLASAGQPANLKDLSNHRTVRYSRDRRPRRWFFPVAGDLIQVDPPTSFMSDDIECLVDAACDGLGIAWLPQWLLAPALAEGALISVLPDQIPFTIDTYLLRKSTDHPSAKLKMTVDLLAKELPEALLN